MGRYLWVSMMSICVYIHAALTVLSHGCCIIYMTCISHIWSGSFCNNCVITVEQLQSSMLDPLHSTRRLDYGGM